MSRPSSRKDQLQERQDFQDEETNDQHKSIHDWNHHLSISDKHALFIQTRFDPKPSVRAAVDP